MTDAPFRVMPAVDDENRFFWTSGEDGRLRFLRCRSCGMYLHPPLPRCPACGGTDLGPEPVSGRGEVFSFTVNHQAWDGSTDPYVIALVALPEQDGLRLTTNIVGCRPADVHIGMPVRVAFERRDSEAEPIGEVDHQARRSLRRSRTAVAPDGRTNPRGLSVWFPLFEPAGPAVQDAP